MVINSKLERLNESLKLQRKSWEIEIDLEKKHLDFLEQCLKEISQVSAKGNFNRKIQNSMMISKSTDFIGNIKKRKVPTESSNFSTKNLPLLEKERSTEFLRRENRSNSGNKFLDSSVSKDKLSRERSKRLFEHYSTYDHGFKDNTGTKKSKVTSPKTEAFEILDKLKSLTQNRFIPKDYKKGSNIKKKDKSSRLNLSHGSIFPLPSSSKKQLLNKTLNNTHKIVDSFKPTHRKIKSGRGKDLNNNSSLLDFQPGQKVLTERRQLKINDSHDKFGKLGGSDSKDKVRRRLLSRSSRETKKSELTLPIETNIYLKPILENPKLQFSSSKDGSSFSQNSLFEKSKSKDQSPSSLPRPMIKNFQTLTLTPSPSLNPSTKKSSKPSQPSKPSKPSPLNPIPPTPPPCITISPPFPSLHNHKSPLSLSLSSKPPILPLLSPSKSNQKIHQNLLFRSPSSQDKSKGNGGNEGVGGRIGNCGVGRVVSPKKGGLSGVGSNLGLLGGKK